MRCHYEVLNVSRDATLDEIKKAYKKLAITWHPDKNLDNTEEATEQFQLIQQSFEVLSDPHERAWYDDHRDAILRGKVGSQYEDDSLDVYQYFTPSCYKGFGDDENGFYSVYREVFNKIAAEDSEYQTEGDSDFDLPNFGKSNSPFEDVKCFYGYWQSYCTKKSYSWLDPYDVRTAQNRKVARIIEKENKKARDKAKKTRNEEVRELVNFIRKRDKRVQAHAQYLQELSVKKAKKSEEKRREKIKERKAEIASHKESEWARFSNLEKELKVIEANLASEFGEEVLDENSESEENEIDKNLYCVACNKLFKTTKAFQNHESSKKHKEKIQILKETMQDSSDDTGLKSDSELEDEYNEITYENDFEEEILSDVEIVNNCNTGESEVEGNSLYCKPCEKSFKTLKAIKNHKLSKKHIINEKLYDDNINEILNSTLTSEEEISDEFDLNDSKRKSSDENLYKEKITVNDGEFMKDIENICAEIDELSKNVIDEENVKRLCDEWDEIIKGESEEELSPMHDSDFLADERISSTENLLKSDKKDSETLNKSYKKKPTKESIFTKLEDSDDDFDFSSKQSKKQKKKSKNKQQILQKNKETLSNSVDGVQQNNFDGKSDLNKENPFSCDKYTTEDSHSVSKELKSNKTLKHTAASSNANTVKVKKQNKNDISVSSVIDTSSSCVICKATFPSKNKLFQHLSVTGHSVYIPQKSDSQKEADRESSKKSKTKRNKK
ncbi:uncharacterized protein LOC142327403 [Lycorma delicatula]|uniref:uncharacterized protein LOC142327403 n=1 Tax=Lycorma delicatula TaxID=130591 RepID=UPI003F519031